MEKTKVISVRVSETLLKKLDSKLKDFPYYKRNGIICKILEGVLDGADNDSLRTLVKHWLFSDKKLTVTVRELSNS